MPYADKSQANKYQRNYRKNYFKTYPWKKTLKDIKTRCNNPKTSYFKYYGGRGIRCLITEAELKVLWFRDKAYEMKKPSIDREDNDGNYEFGNCSYIELVDNIIKGNQEGNIKSIDQYSLEGKYLCAWPSVSSAAKALNIGHSQISQNLKQKQYSCHGFIWRYHENS